MTIDPRFQRIAKRLKTFELVGESDDGEELGLLEESRECRGGDRFLNFYSHDGVCRALEAYGVLAALEAMGLDRHEVVTSSDDPYRHRLQVLLDGVCDEDHRLIDMVLSPRRVREADLVEQADSAESYDMLLVEWLCLQNPRARFTRDRPRLPGQRHPGLGLGYTFHNLTMLIAQRLGRDGVLNVPEHLHLAVIYSRAGYHFVCPQHRAEVQAVRLATARWHLASVAWATERGLIRIEDDSEPEPASHPWKYTPAEMVAPVSKRFERRLGRPRGILRDLLHPNRLPRVAVDLDCLRQSLRDDPVEGMDPDDLLIGPG